MAVTTMLLCESAQQIAVQKLMIEKVPKTKRSQTSRIRHLQIA